MRQISHLALMARARHNHDIDAHPWTELHKNMKVRPHTHGGEPRTNASELLLLYRSHRRSDCSSFVRPGCLGRLLSFHPHFLCFSIVYCSLSLFLLAFRFLGRFNPPPSSCSVVRTDAPQMSSSSPPHRAVPPLCCSQSASAHSARTMSLNAGRCVGSAVQHAAMSTAHRGSTATPGGSAGRPPASTEEMTCSGGVPAG